MTTNPTTFVLQSSSGVSPALTAQSECKRFVPEKKLKRGKRNLEDQGKAFF